MMSHPLYKPIISGAQPLTVGPHSMDAQGGQAPACSTERISQEYSDVGSSSKDGSLRCKIDSEDTSKRFSSAESCFSKNKRILCSQQEDDELFIPESGEGLVSVSSPPRNTAESVAHILMKFGLNKDDLVELESYPEDEITPDNLPLILHRIRIQKQKTAAGISSELHHSSLKNSLDPSDVLAQDDIQKWSGDALPSDKPRPPGQSKKLLQKSVRKVPNSNLDSYTGLSSKRSHALLPGRAPTKQQQLKRKNKDSEPLRSKDSNFYSLNHPDTGHLSTLNINKSSTAHLSHQGLKTSSSEQRKTHKSWKSVEERSQVQQTKKILVKHGEKRQNKPESEMSKHSASSKKASSKGSVGKGPVSKGLPPSSMVNDYAASTPMVFPHTCCLCDKECVYKEDWFSHQNTSFHIESCRLLRKRYPWWDGEIQSLQSTRHSTSLPSTSQPPHRHQNTRPASHSRSRSPHDHHRFESRRDNSKRSSCSDSPWCRRSSGSYSRSESQDGHCGLKDLWHRSRSRSPTASPHRHRGSKDERRGRSRSRSPHGFRDTHRSRSHSWSPWCKRSTSDYPSHPRSQEKRPSFDRREDWCSPRRSVERQVSPTWSDERRTPPRVNHERRLSKEKPVHQRRKSSSTERLTKKMLKTSALQSLTHRSDFETVVKTLTPVLLAEIDKMKSSLFSSSSSHKPGKSTMNPKTRKTERKVGSSAKIKAAVPKKSSLASSVQQKKSKNLGPASKDQSKVVGMKKTKVLKTTLSKKKTEEDFYVGTVDPSEPMCCLTVGEQIETYLDSKDLWPVDSLLSQPNTKILLITNLPEYYDGCYTEADITDLLSLFGFKRGDDIYVIPQKRMALALMPSIGALESAISASLDGVIFRGSKLCFMALKQYIDMSPFGFYCGLMQKICSEVADEASTVYITNISTKEARDLRKALRKIDSVRNFLPLLNKVFVEFRSVQDADRLGVWYSLLKRGRSHKVKRMRLPEGSATALSPQMVSNALPDFSDIISGSKILRSKCGIPQGSIPCFWVSMTTCPYVFPTASPWFNIPSFMTVKETRDIERAHHRGSAFSTIMLTGFRGKEWQYEEIAALVWRYFPQHAPDSLCFDVVVLPLQRRVFVYFISWDSCCSFVRDHLENPVSVQGCPLSVHFVLEDMHRGRSEEVLYRNLMKWGNSHVSEPESLTGRLLCVEVSVVSINLVIFIMKVVASLAPFVNFLPLADRIYVEMRDAGGAARAVETQPKCRLSQSKLWKKVLNIRLVTSIQKARPEDGNLPISAPELDSTAGGAVAETAGMDQLADGAETQPGLVSDEEDVDASFLLPDYFEILDSFDNQTQTKGFKDELSKSRDGPVREDSNPEQAADSVKVQEEREPDEVKGGTREDDGSTRRSESPKNQMRQSSEARGEDGATGERAELTEDSVPGDTETRANIDKGNKEDSLKLEVMPALNKQEGDERDNKSAERSLTPKESCLRWMEEPQVVTCFLQDQRGRKLNTSLLL
ncbi:uncharacterized protein [Nothobranchius furzeri]|uniref:uncharacterized protein isoform X3 n=1 Tax=Nothobranchius furzeri TaxID=105023 RepID=UPI0039048EA6